MTKIIVVDFDDTLALFEGSRAAENIPNAKPNLPLINKLNHLVDKGYEVHIYTARGHISASSREEAKYKYEHIIKAWLKKWNVQFALLSFQKPYAVYYIDDKSIRPDELHLLDNLTKM